MNALTEAIEAAGGVSKLAARMGHRQSVVSNWRAREQVPADQCPGVEAVTGIRCEALRPDLDWQRDSDGKVTGYVVPVTAPEVDRAA